MKNKSDLLKCITSSSISQTSKPIPFIIIKHFNKKLYIVFHLTLLGINLISSAIFSLPICSLVAYGKFTSKLLEQHSEQSQASECFSRDKVSLSWDTFSVVP